MNISTTTAIPAFNLLNSLADYSPEVEAKRILDGIAAQRDALAAAQKQCDDADLSDAMGRVYYEAGQQAIINIERRLGQQALELLALIEREEGR